MTTKETQGCYYLNNKLRWKQLQFQQRANAHKCKLECLNMFGWFEISLASIFFISTVHLSLSLESNTDFICQSISISSTTGQEYRKEKNHQSCSILSRLAVFQAMAKLCSLSVAWPDSFAVVVIRCLNFMFSWKSTTWMNKLLTSPFQ